MLKIIRTKLLENNSVALSRNCLSWDSGADINWVFWLATGLVFSSPLLPIINPPDQHLYDDRPQLIASVATMSQENLSLRRFVGWKGSIKCRIIHNTSCLVTLVIIWFISLFEIKHIKPCFQTILSNKTWTKKVGWTSKAPIGKAANHASIFGLDLHLINSLIFLFCQPLECLKEQLIFVSLACCSSLAEEKQSGKVLRLVDKSEWGGRRGNFCCQQDKLMHTSQFKAVLKRKFSTQYYLWVVQLFWEKSVETGKTWKHEWYSSIVLWNTHFYWECDLNVKEVA